MMKMKGLRRWIAALVVCAVLLSSIAMVFAGAEEIEYITLYADGTVTVYEAPDTESRAVTHLEDAEPVQVIELDETWYETEDNTFIQAVSLRTEQYAAEPEAEEEPAEEPKAAEAPAVEEPAVEEPVAEEAAEEEPVAEETVEEPVTEEASEEPVVEEETVKEPAAEEETVEEPAIEEAAEEEPAAEEEIIMEEPAIEEEPTEEPVAEETIEEEPIVEEPAAEEVAEEEIVVEEAAAEEAPAKEPVAEEAIEEETIEEEPEAAPAAEDVTVEAPATEEEVTEAPAAEAEIAAPEAEAETPETEEEPVQEIEEYETPLGLRKYEMVILSAPDQKPVSLHESADAASPVIAELEKDAEIVVIGVKGGWAMAAAAGERGYIDLEEIRSYLFPETGTALIAETEAEAPAEAVQAEEAEAEAPAETMQAEVTEPEEDPAADMKVSIYTDQDKTICAGEAVNIYSRIEGFDGYEVRYQWICDKHDGNGFQDVEGANESSYSFIASAESMTWDWQLSVYYD